MVYQIPEKFKDIWWEALPLQDARNDRGHAFIVTIYAQDICEREEVNENIVIPAAILHDIGWSQLTEPERMLVFDKSSPKEERLKMRYKHQDEGVRLAKEILEKYEYPSAEIEQILEIISQHDTRDGFLNANEGAMRDADKLWRFDNYGFLNDNQNSATTFEKHFSALEDYFEQEKFFYFESSEKLARKLLGELKKVYKD